MATRGGGLFASLLALLFVALIGFAVVGYAMGWLTIERDPHRTTIELNTDRVREAAEKAQEQGAELIERTGTPLRKSDSPASAPSDRSRDG